MAIIKTCKASLYVMGNRINEVIVALQKADIMEMKDGNRSLPEGAIMGIDAELKRMEKAIAYAQKYRPQKGFLRKKRPPPKSDFDTDKKHTDAARECADGISECTERLAETKKKAEEIDFRIGQCEKFSDFDLSDFSAETEMVKMITLCGKNTEPLEKIRDVPFYYETANGGKKEIIAFCIYLKKDAKRVEQALKETDFTAPEISLSGKTPKEEIRMLKREKKELLREEKELSEKLYSLSGGLRNMELLYDRLLLKRARYSAFLSAENTEKVFVLTGYVPEKRKGELEKII